MSSSVPCGGPENVWDMVEPSTKKSSTRPPPGLWHRWGRSLRDGWRGLRGNALRAGTFWVHFLAGAAGFGEAADDGVGDGGGVDVGRYVHVLAPLGNLTTVEHGCA